MKKVVLFGECMLELKQNDANSMRHAFAGDALNSAVYLKRQFSEIEASFMSALGDDSISHQMLEGFAQEGLDNRFVYADENKAPGIYLVQTDDKGERSFVYWRENSAARQVMQFVDQEVIAELSKVDLFFFSGISLAVLIPEQRSIFWDMVKQLKQAGVQIVFDPNYRARLWQSEEEAKSEFEQAFALSDMLLPGVEDFSQLYQLDSVQQILDFCAPYQINEIVIKNGPESVFIAQDGQVQEVAIQPATTVVDTTSAGDSFNGVYLGARMTEQTPQRAVELASAAATCVIQHPGAIAPKEAFNAFMQKRFG